MTCVYTRESKHSTIIPQPSIHLPQVSNISLFGEHPRQLTDTEILIMRIGTGTLSVYDTWLATEKVQLQSQLMETSQ